MICCEILGKVCVHCTRGEWALEREGGGGLLSCVVGVPSFPPPETVSSGRPPLSAGPAAGRPGGGGGGMVGQKHTHTRTHTHARTHARTHTRAHTPVPLSRSADASYHGQSAPSLLSTFPPPSPSPPSLHQPLAPDEHHYRKNRSSRFRQQGKMMKIPPPDYLSLASLSCSWREEHCCSRETFSRARRE